MLVLGRKLRETVRITVPPSDTAQVIEVQISSILRNKVRLGFEAADDVRIVRAEIDDQQRKESA